MYKLIALDMDGTLLNSDKKISTENFNAIQAARKKGTKVILATGRPLAGVKRYLKNLDMLSENEYVVSFNGGLVQNCGTEEIISKTTLSFDDYRDLYELSTSLNCNIHALTDKEVLTPKHNEYTQIEADINEIPIIESTLEELDPNTTIVKVMFIDHKDVLDRVVQELPEYIKEKYTIVRSMPFFLEFLHKTVNKGFGVSIVADQLGISKDEIICMGDAENDLHMLEYAGLGVAMENAFPKVKEIANYITLSNDNNGVAHVINKFVL